MLPAYSFFVIAQAAFNNLDSCDCFVEAIADQLPYKFADMALIKSKQSTATGKAIQGYDGSVEYTDGIPCMKCSRTFKSWTSLFKHWNQIEKGKYEDLGDYANQQRIFEATPSLLVMDDLEYDNVDVCADDPTKFHCRNCNQDVTLRNASKHFQSHGIEKAITNSWHCVKDYPPLRSGNLHKMTLKSALAKRKLELQSNDGEDLAIEAPFTPPMLAGLYGSPSAGRALGDGTCEASGGSSNSDVGQSGATSAADIASLIEFANALQQHAVNESPVLHLEKTICARAAEIIRMHVAALGTIHATGAKPKPVAKPSPPEVLTSPKRIRGKSGVLSVQQEPSVQAVPCTLALQVPADIATNDLALAVPQSEPEVHQHAFSEALQSVVLQALAQHEQSKLPENHRNNVVIPTIELT